MSPRRESALFAAALAAMIAAFFHASLFGGRVLSPGDVVYASASFGDSIAGDYEPAHRLLMDPVLQFQPWLEFSRSELRAGRLPLWNPLSGCGAPHLANGQSAVFDPFHLIAYLGTLPGAIAWMAFAAPVDRGAGGLQARPVVGIHGAGPTALRAVLSALRVPRGMAALSGDERGGVDALAVPRDGSGPGREATGGRGAGDRLGLRDARRPCPDQRPRPARGGPVCVVEAGGRGVHAEAQSCGEGRGEFLLRSPPRLRERTSHPARWIAGISLGLALSAIEIVPLAVYLTRSPVWADRRAEKKPILSVDRPRPLDAATTAFPYLFGSQRRGHPHLARALGVHNLNESSGGYAGLATLLWLAPAAWSLRRERPRVRFLIALGLFGALGAFEISPVTNALRALPVLDVADNRRMTLWVAFALVMLGGSGIDAVGPALQSRLGVAWTRSWVVLATLFAVGAVGVIAAAPKIRERAIGHYAKAARSEPGADPALYRERAERQALQATRFLPRYGLLVASHLVALAALAEVARRRIGRRGSVRAALVGLVVVDLFACGYDRNPAIPRGDDRPESALIAHLRREVPPPSRIVSVGAELPPNLLMRYGLSDARNYDSIELTRAVEWLEPLYEPEPDRPARTSRRAILWEGAIRARDRLRLANVAAVVAATPPPRGAFDRVDRVGRVWVARLEPLGPPSNRVSPGEIRVDLGRDRGQGGWVAETFDPGWTAEVDGLPAATFPSRQTFLGARLPPGAKTLIFRYRPAEVRIAAAISLVATLALAIVAGAGRTARKTAYQAWKPVSRRVRIEPNTTARPHSTGSPST